MSFISFLEQNQILQTAIGIVLATSITNFVTVTINVFIDPIVKKIAGTEKNKKINFFGIEVEIGVFIIELIDFIIVILLIYIFTKHTIKKKSKFVIS
tara:strand:+ start:102 stop:392 length:291 start_codon:yes stop_codon:yes gene_type:complete